MADLNEVRLIGRLTRDPELRSTPGGNKIASFGFATGSKYRGNDGKMKEEATFVDVDCWEKIAEAASKYLKKGSQVFIGGRLKYESWEEKESGRKRSRLKVVANNIQFLDGKKDGDGDGAVQNKQDDTPQGWEPPKDLPF